MPPRTTILAACVLLVAGGWTTVAAAPVLRVVDVAVDLGSPSRCDVSLTITLDDPPASVAHQLDTLAGATVVLLGVEGGSAEPPQRSGRTRRLDVRPAARSYTLRYRVEQPARGDFRCPIWLPVIPADGRSRAVRISATLPEGATAAGTFPAFAWSGRTGRVTLGHLPAFVHVPFAAAGAAPPWSLARVMDGLSLAVLVAATFAWWRWKGR
ncbi:MAG: hypothetical protein AB7U83_06360 [Vicinamibacterales bacterium]